MAKKTDKSEPKKECPSCGLGVAEQAMICEFCGWDFEEEDEWILQIEKLERDLMLEKQRYEPGTVNHMIESTLRTPMLEKVQPSAPAKEEAVKVEEKPARPPEPASPRERVRKTAPPPEPAAVQAPSPKVRRVRAVRGQPEPPVAEAAMPERSPEPEPEPEPAPRPEPAAAPPRRTVRRVKSSPPAAEPRRKVGEPAPSPAPFPADEKAPVRRTRAVRKVKK